MIHIIINEERRISTRENPRELAIVVNNDLRVPNGVDAKGEPKYTITPRPPQLHTMGKSITDFGNANIVYAAEWDGVSPYVTVLKGSMAGLNMAYLGWPMTDVIPVVIS